MTDDIDPSRLLASAALDDEATSAERAEVAGSGALQAEVEVYRSLRDELRDVEVSPVARESAIAAALAAFDGLAADTSGTSSPVLTGTSTPPAKVVSLQRRRERQYRWLGGAAAAAVVALLVVGVASMSGGEDLKSSSVADQAPPSFEPAAKSPQPETPQAADAATTAAAANTVVAAAAETAGTVLESTEASSETALTTPIDPWADAPSIDSEEALIAYATNVSTPAAPVDAASDTTESDSADTDDHAAATTADTTPASAPLTTAAANQTTAAAAGTAALYSCAASASHETVPVIYKGRRVVVVRDDASATITVIDPMTCVTLETIAIPRP